MTIALALHVGNTVLWYLQTFVKDIHSCYSASIVEMETSAGKTSANLIQVCQSLEPGFLALYLTGLHHHYLHMTCHYFKHAELLMSWNVFENEQEGI